ncbi:Protein of unknown function [Variovorax sp. HW608]|uniref:DUF3489 domain-containing protein n=1 Tax=Variovorax sp. HW608 TaxID=1034889 RepID=UPI00081FC038|nr:DUF3489 domain-containing protein [Variovorax sp. HW608]SCK61222.1 Protein of unknown function [Variovorax sp. HW608]
MSTTQLTPAQHAILAKAINASGGKIDWFPDNVKGGARKKVLEGMANRAFITPDGEGWRVADAGYDALGMKRPEKTQPTQEFDAELEQDVAAAEATWKQQPKDAPRIRENSKQAEVIRMLQRPEGATIRQICDATGWQQHTVRGTFAGAFKKKLGLTITSDKAQGGERIYRVA